MSLTNRGVLRRKAKQDSARQRDEQRSLRSPKQQLALLDERLGVGKGAKKERERLQALINNKKASAK